MSVAKGTLESIQTQFQDELESMRKVQKLQQKALLVQQTLDSQLNENKLVKEEMSALEEGAVIYKLVGPTLLKQDLSESKSNVDKRIDYISKEIKRHESSYGDYEKQLDKHKNESFAEMVKAKEELRKVRDARKKSVKCSLCGSGCITEPEFEKHLLSVHNLTKTQYQEEFGKISTEATLKRFKCELCDEEIEHVRETIALHMKNSHLISWTEYQEILLKIRREDGTESSMEPFDCQVCGERRIKNKKDHLRKKHQMSDEIYDKLLGHRQSSSSTIKTCMLCEHETQDLRKHLERIHRVSYDSYMELTSESKEDDSSVMTNGGSNNHSLRCRYGCEDVFSKEYQLYLHLRLKHDSYDGDEEGSESNKRGLEEKCYLCRMKFFDVASLMAHISSVHDGPSKDNMSNLSGPNSNDSLSTPKNISPSNNNSIGGSFECKLCNRNFKYDRTAINEHLQAAHGINWLGYLDRIRVKADCKICDTSVKNLKEHLMTVHKLTEKEYEARESDKSMNQSALSIDQSVSQNADDFLAVETNIPKPPKSDIQNKTNKTCSSCTITFASRRNFIEHCTTVHNMKFKTKSGLTIQAPKSSSSNAPVVNRKAVTSVAHQLTPSVTIKRKFDTNSNTNFSPPNFASSPSLLKRPRVEGGNDLSSILPQLPQHPLPPAAVIEANEKTLGSHYQTTGVSRWNQCKYQCCFCKKTTQSRSSMTSHIANTHGIPIKEYKERNYPDIEVVTNWFQCRLCSTKTKFVKDCISPHLKMSHSIDIEDYERQYMRPEDWPNCQRPSGGTKSEMRNSETTTTRSLLKPAVPSSPSHPSDEENEKKKWNKCRFQCKICQLITIDARQMRVHISNAHKLSYDNYVAQYGSSEIVTKKFRCELCSSEMKFCRQNIYAHMKDVHKITLSEYEGKVGYVPPPDDDDIDESPEHIVINSDVGTTKPYDCDDNDESSMHSQGTQPQQDHFTSKWNKCRYKCQICQRITSEKPVIRDHIMKQHGFDLEDYEAQYGDVEVVTEYFTCSICSAEVKHCHRNISLHLQKVHNMTTSEYDEGMSQNESPSVSKDNGEIGGFGAHFLLDSNSSDSSSPTRGSSSNGPPIRPPPREDIINPKNKYCMPCNRDFNRRQAFVEHCRNVHRMTINFTRDTRADSEEGQVQTVHPSVVTVTTTPGSLNCDYCGKQFSNRSNRNRHMLLSCEVVKAGGVPRTPHQQMIAEDGGSIKCPMSDCDSYFNVGSSLSGHLADAHGILDKSEDDEERLTASPIKTKDHDNHKSGDEAMEEVKVEFHEEEEEEEEEGEVDFMDTSGEINKDDEASSPVPSVKNVKEEEDDNDSSDDSDSESDDDSDDSDSDSDSDDEDEQKTRESDN
ncbi:uncharacterized protein [Lepeophtheirus salmonis]|uniref:uncharacterized protein isoform X2 n=1 Tax=Lepeophtheirus salmonis TaxID=72036 RepID=UPI003AF3CBE4